MIVITDGDAEQANTLAEQLGRELFAMRDEITPQYVDMDTGIDQALAGPGPVALSDMSDNSGGGAAGDSTFIAQRLIERGVTSAAIGGIWDPIAAGIAVGAGVGARLTLRFGGKTGPGSGAPLDLEVEVMAAHEQATMAGLGGTHRDFGPAACVRAHGIDFVLQSQRVQNFSPSMFEAVGVDWRAKQILVVTSMQHFHAAYAPVVEEVIYIAAPGTLAWDFREMLYTKVPGPVWPLDADPWASNAARAW